MGKYYQADSRWEMYRITCKEQFEKEFVVKGYFHEQVPKDVVGAYTTVEYLLAHAYYYWPMYDEGYNKALRVLEMAIKLKAKEMAIPLTHLTKNGKRLDRKLVDLIEDICHSAHHQYLKQQLHRARNLRNRQMHPDSNSYMGAFGGVGRNLKLFVTVLNQLFRGDDWHKEQYKQKGIVEEQVSKFNNQLLVLENNRPGILIFGIGGLNILNKTLVLVLYPVGDYKTMAKSGHHCVNPFALNISDYQISENGIVGISHQGTEIRIYKTEKAENFRRLSAYRKELDTIPKELRENYKFAMENEALWRIVEGEYSILSQV